MSASDTYSRLFEKVTAEKQRAAQDSDARAAELKREALAEFETKAICLRDVVLPALKGAQQSWAANGYKVLIDDNTTPKEPPHYKADPSIEFSVQHVSVTHEAAPGKVVKYYFEVTHTEGGVKLGKMDPRRPGMEWVGPKYGIAKADELSEAKVLEVLGVALREALV